MTRAGRPRHTGTAGPLDPREEILGASAHLFVTQGVARTSTREIAEHVGMRQASLYYHFPSGKDGILSELLDRTVRPTVDRMDQLKELVGCPATGLYLLALVDVRTLRDAEWNTAFLARLPEVTRSDAYAGYEVALRELTEQYEALGREVEALAPSLAPTPLKLGNQLLRTVETVIAARRTGAPVNAAGIASSCLRICGATTDQIEHAATAAVDVLEKLQGE